MSMENIYAGPVFLIFRPEIWTMQIQKCKHENALILPYLRA